MLESTAATKVKATAGVRLTGTRKSLSQHSHFPLQLLQANPSRHPGGKGELLSPVLVLEAQGRTETRGLRAQGQQLLPGTVHPFVIQGPYPPITQVCELLFNCVFA